MTSAHVLIVGHEPVERYSLRAMLIRAGYTITTTNNGEKATKLLLQQHFDLILTELNLSKVSGLELIDVARNRDPHIQIIVLTAHGTIDSAIAALHKRVYNYICKPCPSNEIISSIANALAYKQRELHDLVQYRQMGESLLKFANSNAYHYSPYHVVQPIIPLNVDTIQAGPFLLDQQRLSIALNGEELQLTLPEYLLLAHFIKNPQQAIDHEYLVQYVLGYHFDQSRSRDVTKVYMWRLRQKIERTPSSPALLRNVRGIGYMLCPF